MYNNDIVKKDLEDLISRNNDYEKLRKKTILITGANGMLASYCMYYLMYLNDTNNMNIKIYALVRNKEKLEKETCYKKRKDIIPIIQDVCDNIEINEKIDYIIHMASSANPKTIIENPVGIVRANVLGTLNVLELARKNNAKVIFASTREVYGDMPNKNTSIKEEDMGILDNMLLRSCYPESKRMAENLFVTYAYQYNVNYIITRIAHVYGPGMNIKDDGRIMSDLIQAVVEKRNIILNSDGMAERAFCYLTDAIDAIFKIMLQDNENEVYNIANEKEPILIRDLAFKLKEMYQYSRGIDIEFNIEKNNNKYVSFKRTKLNTDKLEKIGWKPKISLELGLKRTVAYYDSIK